MIGVDVPLVPFDLAAAVAETEAEEARAFYDMTNSVPFESALWLTGEEMQSWIGGAETEIVARPESPVLTYAALNL